MKNGCSDCEKLPDDKMCGPCELGMLEATAEAAFRDYIDKVNELMKKLKTNTEPSKALLLPAKNKHPEIINDFVKLLWEHSYWLSGRRLIGDWNIYEFSASNKPKIEIRIERLKDELSNS